MGSTRIAQYNVRHSKKKCKKTVFFNEVYMDLKINLKVQEGVFLSRKQSGIALKKQIPCVTDQPQKKST